MNYSCISTSKQARRKAARICYAIGGWCVRVEILQVHIRWQQWNVLSWETPHLGKQDLGRYGSIVTSYSSDLATGKSLVRVKVFQNKLSLVLLGALAKLRKATTGFMSVRTSVRMEQLGSHWTDFHEIWYLSIFRKSVDKNSSFIKIW